jgi:hypothetical protein
MVCLSSFMRKWPGDISKYLSSFHKSVCCWASKHSVSLECWLISFYSLSIFGYVIHIKNVRHISML